MQPDPAPKSLRSADAIDVVLDAAVLGVSAVYPSQRAGIWRFLRDWCAELASRPGVSLHLISSGRAPWNELAVEHVCRKDQFLRQLPHLWRPRPGYPIWRRLQSLGSRLAFRLPGKVPRTAVAGMLQALQPGLGKIARPIPGAIYHSPYHALPDTRGKSLWRTRSITVHDAIPLLHPEWFDDITPYLRALDSITARDTVFVDSESTKRDLVHWKGLDPRRILVAYPGISGHFRVVDRSTCRAALERLGVPDVRFLLAVGTLEPRKNLPALLEAFARVAVLPGNEDLHLVLVGARGWRNEVLDATFARIGAVRARVLRPGFVADEDLPLLYGACEAFVFASLYEGFGLPIAEAMACGAPVLCVDNSSQREVAGDVAMLSPGPSAEELSRCLGSLLSDADRRADMRRRGPAQSARFTWKACIDVHLDAWAAWREDDR
ncbi:MAG: glycosyltransferase family 4 protein [Fibrobacteria bacterium]|nr:glycosyltransferase family 4 protein [Fibrobacteria bacterium]